MAKGHDIRRRIKSVKNTKSITKAMEMVAASKMKKAQDQALQTRAYAEKALEILARVSDKVGEYPHYLLNQPKGNRILILLVTSNKGLCGSLNTNIIRKMAEFIQDVEKDDKDATFKFLTLGKKGREACFRFKYDVEGDYSDVGDSFSFNDIRPMIKFALDEFKAGKYDRVYVAYTHFVSVLSQKPVMKRIVPLGGDILETVQEILTTQKQEEGDNPHEAYEYIFEPNPKEVLDELLPKMVEMQVYQSVLEAYASEQSARMMAMKNATEAAGELIDDLTLIYNKTRQAGITQEIAEIVGGVEALKDVKS